MNSVHSPFGSSKLTAEWPVLTAACSGVPLTEPQLASALSLAEWDTLFCLAEEHGVTGHLARVLRPIIASVPKRSQEQLNSRRRAQIVSTLAMTSELASLLKTFARLGLEVLVVKGPVLSVRAYGDAGMRTYGDIDLLVRNSDIERATKTMEECGFKPQIGVQDIKSRGIPGEYVFQKAANRMLVELHTEKSLRFFPKQPPVGDYFRRRVALDLDGHSVPAMASEDELVHICVHGTKHLWERLLWIADIAGILRRSNARETTLDWGLVAASARCVGAGRMLALGLHLAAKTLDAPLPDHLAREIRSDHELQRIAKDIQRRLPYAGYRSAGLIERAAFRARMRGGGIPGFLYLWRLTVSPTERDWQAEGGSVKTPTFLRRLRRLAREHGQRG